LDMDLQSQTGRRAKACQQRGSRLDLPYGFRDGSVNLIWPLLIASREAWAYQQPHRFLLFDRDAKFGGDVISAVKEMGSEPTRTAIRSPWQNGVAERWVGRCRRDLLDHVIILNERHLKRLMSSYLLYYHEDRTHLGLAKDTPAGRATEIRPAHDSRIQSFPRLGGLHHRYAVAA
jgi:putative transposase